MEVSALRQASMPGLPGSVSLLRLQSDERLIALVRRGHHTAFEALVSRYEARLLSFCRHMLGSKEDAEDVLQEVFTAAFNAILADEREINVRPWLYRIARNRSLNHLRRATPVGVDSMDIYYAENGQSTGEKILRRESFRQLIGDVQGLPETQRTALLLREIDALSYEQIAETMETTVPSVKSLLVRARISLAEAAEARKLSCEEVRLELGEVAEGLIKISAPARRHVRDCDRCCAFKKHLKDNNHALAAILPVAPLLMLKKLVLTKLGSTASAGASHVAGAAGGGATATAAASGGATAAVGAGAAATGGGIGSLAGLGAGALATKAVAGLAAAALVTAGAVEADHATTQHLRHHRAAALSASANDASHHSAMPIVVRSEPQPVTPSPPVVAAAASSRPVHRRRHAVKKIKPPVSSTSTTTPVPSPTPPPITVVKPAVTKAPAVTEVTTETTELPPTTAPSTTATPSPEPATPPTSTPEQTPPAAAGTTPEAPPVTPPPSGGTSEGIGSPQSGADPPPTDPSTGAPATTPDTP
jgi:RNA polymerase sigma factor (sigma-70 family)